MIRSIVALVLLVFLAAQPAQLKIVVLDGEGAVNIIQQKTAVRAVVEVRDQNNLPVSGASVTFAVTGKGGATVAGSPTVTVASNSAGQASLTGMTPSSSGGLQISVNASFKGITAATTTITQTVVATAAAAAAIAGAAATTGAVAAGGGTAAGATAAAGGAAAATGGGLGTGAIIGIVGGVAAAGAGVAVASGAAGGQRDERDEPFVPTGNPNQPTAPTCVFSVSPTTLTVPIAGGTFVVNVTVTPSGCIPQEWAVTNVPPIVTVDRMGGTGNGSVTITVAPFTPSETFPTRTAAIGVAGTVVNIHQPRPIS